MYKISKNFGSRAVKNDQELVLNVFTGQVYMLNDVSAVIWAGIRKCYSEEEILDSILEVYDIPKKIAQNDLFDFIKSLEKRGFLE